MVSPKRRGRDVVRRLSTGGNAGFCTENPFYRPTVRTPLRPRMHPRRKR